MPYFQDFEETRIPYGYMQVTKAVVASTAVQHPRSCCKGSGQAIARSQPVFAAIALSCFPPTWQRAFDPDSFLKS